MLFSMAEAAYNNAKITSTDYILFKLNYSYYPHLFYEEDVDLYSKWKSAKKLLLEL